MRYAFFLKTLPDPDLLGMPITERCWILGVSPSGFYEWRNRQLGCPRQKTYQAKRSKINDETIVMTIRRIPKILAIRPVIGSFMRFCADAVSMLAISVCNAHCASTATSDIATIADLTKRLTAITV